jgi:hypothetical protein
MIGLLMFVIGFAGTIVTEFINWNSDANPVSRGVASGLNQMLDIEPSESEKAAEKLARRHALISFLFWLLALAGFITWMTTGVANP